MQPGQQGARVWLGAAVVPLLSALGSCGETSSSHPRGSAGVAATAAGSNSAGSNRAGTSSVGAGGAGSNSAGGASGAGQNGHGGSGTAAGSAGRGGDGLGGASDSGQAGDASVSGAAGANGCVNVCELYGEACCTDSANCVSADSSCVIEVFDTGTATSVTNDYAALEQRVASLPPIFKASVSTADVVSSAADPFPASRIELHLSEQASASYAQALDHADMQPFRVSCAGKSLFVGQVYLIYGAAGISTPVLHVSHDANDALVLKLGARQGAWALSNSAGDVAERMRLDRPELRSTLCLGGALQKL